jgi:hypothetical protein
MPFVYKKLKGSDVALVPFNAHKTWSFDSASATNTGSYDDASTLHPPVFAFGTASWTSMSIDQYSTSSAQHWKRGSHLKYYQLDHLFYKGYPRGTNALNLYGDVDYNNQRRELNESLFWLSIPQQTYGQQIKPGTFYLSMSVWHQPPRSGGLQDVWIVRDDFNPTGYGGGRLSNGRMQLEAYDDGKGNLIHSKSGVTPQPNVTDIDARVFHIGPTKGFEKIDLHTDETGRRIVNPPLNNLGPRYNISQSSCTQNFASTSSITRIEQKFPTYSRKWIYDDTYYGNLLYYKNVTFHSDNKGPVDFSGSGLFKKPIKPLPHINFHGNADGTFRTSSYSKVAGGTPDDDDLHMIGEYHVSNTRGSTIISPHNEKWNFDVSEDFTIAFWMIKACEMVGKVAPSGSGTADLTANGTNHPEAIATEERDYIPNKQWLIGKSTTKTVVPSPQGGGAEEYTLSTSGSAQEIDVDARGAFPFEVYFDNKYFTSSLNFYEYGSGWSSGGDGDVPSEKRSSYLHFPCPAGRVCFRRSDGIKVTEISNMPEFDTNYTWGINGLTNPPQPGVTASCHPESVTSTNKWHHVVCQYSQSIMYMWVNGYKCPQSASDAGTIVGDLRRGGYLRKFKETNPTINDANLYIGSKGAKEGYLTGSLAKIQIFDYALSEKEISYLITSSNYPYIGNVFYNTGIATITDHFFAQYPGTIGIDTESYQNNPAEISYQGTMPIIEHEYQCTVDENDFNFTNNVSVRRGKSNQKQQIQDTYTGSMFKPYVTTVGLYNEENELLVVGKLGQPVRMSDETDTTFVLRWDT